MSSNRSGEATRTGLGSIDSERFDAMAAVGGWRGVVESVVPTLVFVLVVAVRPTALVPALGASLTVSAVGLVARLAQRQSLAQVLGGIVLVLLSALWAWRSGDHFIEGGDLPSLFPEAYFSLVEHGNTGRVVAAIFQAS